MVTAHGRPDQRPPGSRRAHLPRQNPPPCAQRASSAPRASGAVCHTQSAPEDAPAASEGEDDGSRHQVPHPPCAAGGGSPAPIAPCRPLPMRSFFAHGCHRAMPESEWRFPGLRFPGFGWICLWLRLPSSAAARGQAAMLHGKQADAQLLALRFGAPGSWSTNQAVAISFSFIPAKLRRKNGHDDMNRVTPAGLLVLVWLDVACSVMSEGAPPVLLALPGPLFPRADFSPPTQECAAGVLLCLVSVHCEGTRGGRAEACSLLAPGNAGGRGERFVINGAPLYLGENPQVASASHEVLTAASVWDCSLMLAKYVERHAERFRGKTVLELGAQTIRAVRPHAR